MHIWEALTVLSGLSKTNKRAREFAQWLRALASLKDYPGLMPSTHMTAHYCL